jgi:GDP-4-dehydro-6-deoxy-D-mannose reductase
MKKNKKTIIITGATGFVGSHMADYLVKNKNLKIYCTKRYHLSKTKFIKNFYTDVIWKDCDITDPIATDYLIKKIKPNLVLHFAAESFVSPSWLHPNRYMAVNYNGTINLLNSIKNHSPKTKILIPGSGEEYGDLPKSQIPINEYTILNPVNPYAVTKIAQDLIGYVYYKSYNLNVIRCRTFNHEGPRRENVFGISSYAYQIARIENNLQEPIILVGDLSDKRNFTHVFDIVRAYWLAINKCIPGELYLIGNQNKNSIFSFEEALKKLMKMSFVKSIKIKKYNPFVRPTRVSRLIIKSNKFENLTGWKATTSFNSILQDTLEYWRSEIKKGSINLY